jgi:hypothetical protein
MILESGLGSVSRFIGYLPGRNTIDYNTFSLTVTITFPNYEQFDPLKVTVTTPQ